MALKQIIFSFAVTLLAQESDIEDIESDIKDAGSSLYDDLQDFLNEHFTFIDDAAVTGTIQSINPVIVSTNSASSDED